MYADCFDELERIDYNIAETVANSRFDGSFTTSPRNTYRPQIWHSAFRRRFQNDPAGYVWRAVSLTALGCTQEAYDDLQSVAARFDGIGMVPYVLAVLTTQLQRMDLARDWLVKAFATPDGKQLKLLALEERELDGFWREIGAM
jgi:hypothetical protein